MQYHSKSMDGSRTFYIHPQVYAILGIQLFLTAAVTFVFFQKPALVSFLFTKGSWVVLLSVLASLGSAIALGMRYSRVFPTNLGLLSLFTAGESVLIGEYEEETIKRYSNATENVLPIHHFVRSLSGSLTFLPLS